MPLLDLIATPHPDGHRIDLSWANPDPVAWPGVRVVRREGTHPTAPDDGTVVADGTDLAVGTDALGRALFHVADVGLQGETTYYYHLFPYRPTPLTYSTDRANRTAALAGAVHGQAARMYALLPALYHRYDETGQLRRFLDLPGGQLDLLWSGARALLDLFDVQRVDGRLLPLLAEWIAWKTDFRLEIDAQRAEVRRAPAIYQRIGMIPVVGATVKRISGWESRSKEFVHNVFVANRPPRLNLWSRLLGPGGATQTDPETGEPLDGLLSLDFAYEGRPVVADDAHGIRWLLYHTLGRDGWRLWTKTSPTFALGLDALPHLEGPDVAALQAAFLAAGVVIAADAVVTAEGSLWRVDDATNGEMYVVEQGDEGLTVYHTSAEPRAFAPSRPLNPADDTGDERFPTAALQGDTLWVFWSAYDAATERWSLRYRLRRDGAWGEVRPFTHGSSAPTPERRSPAAVVDDTGGLWLFWLQREGGRWQLRYNRHDGSGIGTDPDTGWERDPAEVFPLDGGDDPRVEEDLFVLFNPNDAARPLWVWWARKEATADPTQRRWTVALRVKASTDPSVSDWDAVTTLPKPDETAHDREPAPRVLGDGTLGVFWSSNRDGSWGVWRAALDLDDGSPWSGVGPLTGSPTAAPYAQRTPLPVPVDGGVLLLYRSDESLGFASSVYAASRTVDFRYAGSSTVHTRNTALLDLRGAFEDFGAYTHDAGRVIVDDEGREAIERTDDDWYARDTLGVYLDPDTVESEAVARQVGRLRSVLPAFMPATDRAVFLTRRDAHTEYVYTYDRPGAPDPRTIAEHWSDALTSPVGDELPPDEDFTDALL